MLFQAEAWGKGQEEADTVLGFTFPGQDPMKSRCGNTENLPASWPPTYLLRWAKGIEKA